MHAQGHAERRFATVRDAFEANFTERGDLGAAFCLYAGGRKVVDLWGGTADARTGRPWQEDTLALVYSTTKGVSAICTHLMAQRQELDLDAPVVQYWPEYGVEGKAATTVADLLSHRAGLPVLEPRLPADQALAWDPAVQTLAAQRPLWEPGTRHGYHAVTFGWLVGEVVRRATGRSLGRYLAEEVAGPLGLDLWIGLPEPEEGRVSRLRASPPPRLSRDELAALPPERVEQLRAMASPASLTSRALNPTDPPFNFNQRAVHAAELPAANGIATARALAKLYATTVGEVDGVRLLRPDTVAAATVERSAGPDAVLLLDNRFGAGFFLPSPFSPLLGPRSFGHSGAGGSLAFADPDAGIGFAYVMNQMQQNLAADPRPAALIDAVRRCLDQGGLD
ncbi:MAG TPA: serine hydrolase domain-containing protein [Acidimicrobiales bacterium]|nr:serine hydrolase domain-containing protein [Acidimicrobiales bacterium]